MKRFLIKSTLLMLVMVSMPQKGQAQLEDLSKLIIGPHFTVGYEYRDRANFNLGYSFSTIQEDGWASFRFKPNVSFGQSTIYGFSTAWYPFISDKMLDKLGDSLLDMSIALSTIGVNALYAPETGSTGMEAVFRFPVLVYFDLELGHAWRFAGVDPSFDGVFKLGFNFNFSTVMVKK